MYNKLIADNINSKQVGETMNTKTLMYIVKRVLLAIVTIWVVITVTFFVMHAVPGGPFTGEKAVTKQVMAAMEAKYGLDKPLGTQYLTYLKDVCLHFDFGPSLKQLPTSSGTARRSSARSGASTRRTPSAAPTGTRRC